MIGVLLLAAALQQTPRALVTNPAPSDEGIRFQVSLEAGALALPSGQGLNGMDGFALVFPRMGVRGGDEFEFELGAPLRLRLFDSEPAQLAGDFGGRLRREDWDQPSDFGQLVRTLRVGRDDGPLQLRAGSFSTWTLGAGWLINRYNPQLSPDYHPAGANAVGYFGPTRVELFASDVLGARLFAGELRLDLGRVLSDQDTAFDRYLLSVDVAHDFGRAGGTSPSLSAVSLGFQAGVVHNPNFQLWLQAAAGARADTLIASVPDYGAAFGIVARGRPDPSLDISGRLEARRQGGLFRFGVFGAGYELARFSGVGLNAVPLAAEALPGTFSGYGEVAVTVIPGSPDDLSLSASASGEYFVTTGRVDSDLALQLHLPGNKTVGELRAILTDVGGQARPAVSLELRQRFLPAVYGLLMGGTVYFPQPTGGLLQGFTAGLGVGVDFQR